MTITICFKNGTRQLIHNVLDITWGAYSVYIDVSQIWNECNAPDEPYVFEKEKIEAIIISFKEGRKDNA